MAVAAAAAAPTIIAPSIGIVGTSITWTAAASFAVQAAAVGFSIYQQQAQQRALQAAYSAQNNEQSLQQVLKQPIPPQRLILGHGTVSGALFFAEGNESTSPYLYYGLLLAAHECDGLDSLFLNNTKVVLDENGEANSVPFFDGSNTYIKVSFRNGHIDQAIDPLIAADFPDIPTSFRQRGHCTAVVKALYGRGGDFEARRKTHERLYGNQAFTPVFRVRGAKIYDPRDPSQVLADPATYRWSENASLCLAHFIRVRRPEMADRIDWARVAEAADIDDNWLITKAGRVIRKHTVNGVIDEGENMLDVLGSLLTANSGNIIIDDGKVYPLPSHRKTPVGTLDMASLKGGFSYSPHKAFKDLQNIVSFEFPAKERDRKKVVGPVRRDDSAITADGVEREVNMTLAFTEDHERAQFIAARNLKRNRLQKALSCGVNMKGFQWKPGKVIEVWFTGPYARMNGQWEIAFKNWDDEINGYQLELIEYDPSVEDWDAQTEELDFDIDEALAETA